MTFIYGDVKAPRESGSTINSVGKTMLLKFINYIFGATFNKKDIAKPLQDFYIKAVILVDRKKRIVKRTFAYNQNKVILDGNVLTLDEYKKELKIDRSLFNKQILLKPRPHEISNLTTPTVNDILAYLQLLKLDNLIASTKAIYEYQDAIKALKKSQSDLIAISTNKSTSEINKEIFLNDKKIEELEAIIEQEKESTKNLSIVELQEKVIDEYKQKRTQLKNELIAKSNLEAEFERLTNYLEEFNKNDITATQVMKLFKKANQEVNEMVKKQLQDVQEFYNKVYLDRKEFLDNKINQLKSLIDEKKSVIEKLDSENKKIEKILSNNKIYNEALELYNISWEKLNELKFKQGRLSKIKEITEVIEKYDEKLSRLFSETKLEFKKYDILIDNYKTFLYDFTKSIYRNKNIQSYFDIKVMDKHLTRRPIVIDVSLTSDAGEGVSEVKKNLIDYLVFNFNDKIDILIHDSSCYNGIDLRQINSMLIKTNEIATNKKKQFIVSINKYQLENLKLIQFVEKIVL